MTRTRLVTRTRNIITRIGNKGRVIIDHPVAVGSGGGRERGVVRGFFFFHKHVLRSFSIKYMSYLSFRALTIKNYEFWKKYWQAIEIGQCLNRNLAVDIPCGDSPCSLFPRGKLEDPEEKNPSKHLTPDPVKEPGSKRRETGAFTQYCAIPDPSQNSSVLLNINSTMLLLNNAPHEHV